MQIKELIINEEADELGVDAISLVSNPAIESGFITLSKDEKLKLQAVDSEKLILCGPALIPNKKIYRKGPTKKEGYYIYFSKKTVRQASELFLKNNNQKNHTLEHKEKATGLTVVESWIKDGDQDKSNLYNLDVPVGTWLISVKCDNKEIYEDCKNGVYYGFSIEGFFSEKLQKHELRSFVIDDEIAIIDDRNAYSTKEKALKVAKDVGCNGYHEHNFEGKTWFMPCEKHSEQEELKTVDLKNPCTKGYEQRGMKMKNGKKVPNCIPVKNDTNLESYNDYPDSVKNNAKKGVELNEKNNNKCATLTGKNRGADLSAGRPVQVETIKRMYSYLSRARTYYDKADKNECGYISYMLWGGPAALIWSEKKLKELGLFEASKEEVNEEDIIQTLKDLIKEHEQNNKKD